MIATKLPSWRHHHFIKDNKDHRLYRLEDANFEPPHAWWPIVELQDVHTWYGEHYLVVSESQDLSTADVALARLTTFGTVHIDEGRIHAT
jgi:hypothetical protein